MFLGVGAALTLILGPAAGGAERRSSHVVGTPLAFIYHAPNEGPDRVVVGGRRL